MLRFANRVLLAIPRIPLWIEFCRRLAGLDLGLLVNFCRAQLLCRLAGVHKNRPAHFGGSFVVLGPNGLGFDEGVRVGDCGVRF